VPLPAKPAPDAATAPKPAPAPAVGHDAKQVPEAQTTPAPPPEEQVSWTDAEVLAARARCVEALAPVVAEVRIADPVRAGQCGAPSPVLVQSIGRSPVALRPPVTMNCPLVVALHDWLERSVQPLAREVLGEEIASLDGLSGYQCRNRAGGGKLSEHGLANALDILTLRTRSGRVVSVLDHWGPTPRDVEPPADPAQEGESAEAGKNGQRRGDRVVSLDGAASGAAKTQVQRVASTARRTNAALAAATPLPTTPEAIFLKRIHAEACTHFKTVLGPDANEDHRNHLHLDLAPRARGGAYCR
jgi:hypothetical protein